MGQLSVRNHVDSSSQGISHVASEDRETLPSLFLCPDRNTVCRWGLQRQGTKSTSFHETVLINKRKKLNTCRGSLLQRLCFPHKRTRKRELAGRSLALLHPQTGEGHVVGSVMPFPCKFTSAQDLGM